MIDRFITDVDRFITDVKHSLKATENPPVILLWNLNAMAAPLVKGKGWQERAQAVKSLLAARPKEAVALIIHRKHEQRGPGGLNTQIAAILESGGCSLETDVTLAFTGVKGQSHRSAVYTAWLAVSGQGQTDHAWAKASQLLAGMIGELAPVPFASASVAAAVWVMHNMTQFCMVSARRVQW